MYDSHGTTLNRAPELCSVVSGKHMPKKWKVKEKSTVTVYTRDLIFFFKQNFSRTHMWGKEILKAQGNQISKNGH